MLISTIYSALREIARTEFVDIILQARVMALPTGDPLKLRLDVVDGSLLDIFVSASGRYSYHWDRRLTTAANLYRHDNAPHRRWRAVSTFPKHFHSGSEDHVIESHISDNPEQALREFLAFARHKLLAKG